MRDERAGREQVRLSDGAVTSCARQPTRHAHLRAHATPGAAAATVAPHPHSARLRRRSREVLSSGTCRQGRAGTPWLLLPPRALGARVPLGPLASHPYLASGAGRGGSTLVVPSGSALPHVRRSTPRGGTCAPRPQRLPEAADTRDTRHCALGGCASPPGRDTKRVRMCPRGSARNSPPRRPRRTRADGARGNGIAAPCTRLRARSGSKPAFFTLLLGCTTC